MGQPLKNQFDREVPRAISQQISAVWEKFRAREFLADVFRDYENLELMDRGRAIAIALGRYLPSDYPAALSILMRSIHEPHEGHNLKGGMAGFYYHPHTTFIAMSGLEHFDISMQAQHELTQLFSAEFSIRAFIEKHERKSLELLRVWAADPSDHVRRLVSEGTRPRLPWGKRLRSFQEDPRRVIELLEMLKDDSSRYVRRSVANNLNDIGKDHPEILIRIAKKWMKGASDERKALVQHALRSLVKQGDTRALAILGFGGVPAVSVESATILPTRVCIGDNVVIAFTLRSSMKRRQTLLVDLRIHYRKANGTSRPKVFKLKKVVLAPSESASFRKTISISDMTTRKHYPGRHVVDILVNGTVETIGAFDVKPLRI